MEAVFCILLYIILAPLAYFSLRRTPLEISINRGVFAGVFLFRELFGLIGLAVVLLNIYSPNYFHGFRNTDEGSVFFISLVVFYGLIVFLLTVGVLLKSLFFGAYKRMQEMPSANSLNMVEYKNFLRLGFSLALLGLVIALYGSIRYGAEHAFLGALIYGGDLREIRLANIHVAEMPTFFNSFRGFCYIFLAAVLGGMSFYKSRFSFVFFALTVLYLSTYGGSKAPPVQAFIVYLVSSSCFSGFRIDVRAFLKIIIASVVIVSSIVFVVWLQKGNMNIGEFLSYIVNRLGVGQMAGTYEQFNLKLRNPSYVLHAVPFAGYLTEYPVFQKELMMASEFVNDAASTGVKNSFFISEAYAFGGMHMVVFSPFVVGASYAISLFVVFIMVRYLFVKNIMASIRLSGVLFSSYFSLTGGMSEWLFFKALIMVCIFFVPVYGVFLVLAAVSRIKITFGRLAFHKVHLV